jgi:biopolymer transport protein ExbD
MQVEFQFCIKKRLKMQMQNRFFTKKDAINITPFLDIMLVLFIIIIVVASFNNYDSLKEQKKLEELVVKIKKLEKENKNLILKNSALTKENKKIKNFVSQFTMKVIIYQDFLTINGVEYSFEDFKSLVKNGIIKRVQFYYYKDEKSINNYKKLNQFLDKFGWDLKNSE